MNAMISSTGGTSAGMRHTPAVIVCVALLLLTGVATGFAQSIDVRDGANAIGLAGHLVLDPDMSVQGIGGRSAYSIAGVMDVGVSMSNAFEETGDVRGTVQNLSLLYSVLPVKQQPGIPVSLKLGLSYGISFVDPDLVRAELERDIDRFSNDDNGELENIDARRYDGTRTGYVLSAGLGSDVPFNARFSLRLGLGGEYRVQRTNYTAILSGGNDDNNGDVSLIGERIQSTHFGPGVGLVYRSPRGIVTSWNNRLLFDESFEVQYRPELSVSIVHR